MLKKTLRPAIAMIELIFAIVVMGIVLMTAPMLISTAAKSGYVATQQEGIHEAASRISMIMGYYWDENNTLSSNAENVILTTDSTVPDLNGTLINGILIRRIGTPKESKRAFVGDMGNNYTATASASLGSDSDTDDIDDFNGNVNLTEINASTADYIEKGADINIATSVEYISDVPSAGAYNSNTLSFNPNFTATGSSHIKRITATLTSTSGVDELNKTIILHAFSCNIGGTGELGWK